MGRLPDQWAGRKITMRIPYNMYGELIMAGSQSTQFNQALFTNNVDMPMEIHRVIPRVVALNSSNNVLPNQPAQEMLCSLVRSRIEDFGKNALMTKAPTMIENLLKGSSERTWEWAEPYYIKSSEGFNVALDTLVLPTWDGAQIPTAVPVNPLAALRIQWDFQGFLIVVAPPSETRGG